ncbi:unnamed protein product [Citrullus colocynthis]|uniref:Uncharacterized protein n=1 Tax=Citrullus colocynthis TaxID=252529 RepID=A0ABP0XMY8_9ROSI
MPSSLAVDKGSGHWSGRKRRRGGLYASPDDATMKLAKAKAKIRKELCKLRRKAWTYTTSIASKEKPHKEAQVEEVTDTENTKLSVEAEIKN